MKQLPDEKTLLEMLELSKAAEQKTKEAGELMDVFIIKWETKLKDFQRTPETTGGV
ncbi:hypothetical protein NG798_12405 [Ancylothrix sp. C2]|uniref:hypothetical protein n=1 Tax=Ancylothrix sp. D3o TaxID=2953691 RepID=UPI0021BBA72C|nr:hypothetical protein [Ancylothrix sp. D3o]MCT7950595.1 hypothetical protein [Ancylothrix sp. D3o]